VRLASAGSDIVLELIEVMLPVIDDLEDTEELRLSGWNRNRQDVLVLSRP